MALRFRDTGQTIYEFAHKFLVHCPQCDNCARVVPKNNEDTNYFAPRRLICTECGYVKDWAEKSIRWVSETDWYFCLPLWLQTPCGRKTLWAYNKVFNLLLSKLCEPACYLSWLYSFTLTEDVGQCSPSLSHS